MPAPNQNAEMPPAVRRTLDDVRRRIRAYVWLEGLAILVILIGAAFWIGLALDWFFEPSPWLRQIALGLFAAVAVFVGYRYLFRRAFSRISDRSLAVLLERRFPSLEDHLLTTVDVAEGERGV